MREGLSENEALPWSLDLIEHFKDRWDWGQISQNESLPWSIELIDRYEDRWQWSSFSYRKFMPWSLDLIERYEARWAWKSLSGNESLPWSLDFIDRYADRWAWGDEWPGGLSSNKALPWSLDLIERYEDRWDWQWLLFNMAVALPLLRSVNIVEIMSFHFPENEIKIESTMNDQQAAKLMSIREKIPSKTDMQPLDREAKKIQSLPTKKLDTIQKLRQLRPKVRLEVLMNLLQRKLQGK